MAFDGPKRGRRRQLQSHAHDTDANNIPPKQKHEPSERSSNHSTGDKESGGEPGESNMAASEDEDEDEEDGADAAAFAPSRRAANENTDQTGPSNNRYPRATKQKDQNKSSDDSVTRRGRTLRRDVEIPEQTLSEDDDYSGVNMISDSEERGQEVRKLEERAIIESEEADDGQAMPSILTTTVEETDDGWGDFDPDDGLFMADVPYFEEQFGRTDSSVLGSEIDLFHPSSRFGSFSPPPIQLPSPRRVRFATPRSEGPDVVSDDGDIPALFEPSQNGFVDDNISLGLDDHGSDDTDGDSGGSSSGYESGSRKYHMTCGADKLCFQLITEILLTRKMLQQRPHRRQHDQRH